MLKLAIAVSVLSVGSWANQCQGTCNRSQAKKVYIMGPIGIGKSTFCNVLTGQSPSEGCYKVGATKTAMTTSTYDLGCYPVVDGSFGQHFVVVDTPGLNDKGKHDIDTLMTIETYHNSSLDKNDLKASAFVVLVEDGRTFNKPTETMLEHMVRSFGPTFWKHLIFCYVKMPFTEDNILGKWPFTDDLETKNGRPKVYGENLSVHKVSWGKAHTALAYELTKKHFDGKFKAADIPDFSKRIVYIDVWHKIIDESYAIQQKGCELANMGNCDRYKSKFLNNNPQVLPNFNYQVNELSKTPYQNYMLSAEHRLWEEAKIYCKAKDFYHWNDTSKKCEQNKCNCSGGTPLESKLCATHGSNSCASCANSNYQLMYSGIQTRVGDKTINILHCQYKRCGCSKGYGYEGSLCPYHGAQKCRSCRSGYRKASHKRYCKPYWYRIDKQVKNLF